MIRTIRLAWAEIGRHHRLLHRVALTFMLIVPTLYGALYLWSNWDPYGRLDEIPVAVVNEDRPVTVDGKDVDGGAQVIANFKSDPIFDWVFTDAEDAAAGLSVGTYYLTITIPSDFSSRLASGAGSSPERAEIVINRDDANGYVIGVMAETVQAKLHEQINSAATQAYFESVYGSLATLRDGIQQADDGATTLRDGLTDAESGSKTLAAGLVDAVTGAGAIADGATELETGSQTLADGTQTLADVINPLADTIVPAIPVVAQGAADVADAVADVSSTVSGGADSLTDRVNGTQSALDALIAANPDLANDPLILELQGSVSKVTTRAEEIDATIDSINTDVQALDVDAQKLVTAVPDLQTKVRDGQSKINELNDGAHEVHDGIVEIADGATELHTKLGDAATGAQTLADGLTTASSGSQELVDGLDTLVAAVPALDPDQQENNATILGNPTQVTLQIANDAEVYGRGLAPFFFSIALWVFGIVIFLVLRPTSGRALVSRASSWRVAVVGWLPILGIGLAGAYLLLAVATWALGLNPVNVWGSIGLISLAVAVFTLIAHLCRSGLGLVGSAVLLVTLMLQLAASAGIYPAQTLPPALEAIHPYLPMTYLIEGLRVTFTGGSDVVLHRAVVVLVGVGVAAFLATWAVIAKRRTWTIDDVHPPLED